MRAVPRRAPVQIQATPAAACHLASSAGSAAQNAGFCLPHLADLRTRAEIAGDLRFHCSSFRSVAHQFSLS